MLVIPAYAAGPWKGRIIDIETKEPIEGAVVLAVWMRAYRTPAGDNTYFYNAKEVLTDKEGRFEISAYRPINLLPIISYIKKPEFTIFKPGYLRIEVSLDENVTNKAVELTEWRLGKTFKISSGIIELPKLKTREERLRNIPGGPTDVGGDKLPILYKLINEERRHLGLEGEVWR